MPIPRSTVVSQAFSIAAPQPGQIGLAGEQDAHLLLHQNGRRHRRLAIDRPP
ncbi:hypothetical protein ABZ780_00775 [Micromonospora sp. NPDC047467]|uniref:hypothetical protein n=1 Tax=Micromonospora sp. NPDC047467 TaxID=3154814 RepID=UPI0033FAFA78